MAKTETNKAGQISATRLTVGEKAPSFTLPDSDGTPVSLGELGRVLVYVYPAAMTPGCTSETVDFNKAAPYFAEAGLKIVGISPDLPEKLTTFREKYDIGFPLLSDPEKTMLSEWAAFGEKKNYGKTFMGVIRSTFVVETDGTLSFARYNVRAKGHVAMVASLLDIELPDSERS